MAPRGSRRAPPEELNPDRFCELFEALAANVGKVIKGKQEVVRLALVGLLANGHLLIEDVPGTGKTMLARAVAQTVGARIARIQCTPDMLPSDVTGSPVLDRKTGELVFRPGPIFAEVVLVDEINRATPKTQSAFLEAMQEHGVTVDGVRHQLPDPFWVLATQNPVELAGTFPLPEAQLDRFLFRLTVGYTDRKAEAELLEAHLEREPIECLEPLVDLSTVLAMRRWAAGVTVGEPVRLYIVDLVHATRTDPSVQLGGSARASLALLAGARVLAAARGREDVIPDDVNDLLRPVLSHRILLSGDALLREETIDGVIDRIRATVYASPGIAAARHRAGGRGG